MEPLTHVLDGKVVIITGASSGIGAATARALAPLGCRLVLVARSPGRLEALAAELDAKTLVAAADVADPVAVQAMVDRTVEHFGRVDVMFANAGIYFPGRIDEGDPADWSKLLDINIGGVLNCTHAVLAQMKAQGSGDILVTSSIAGHSELRDEPIYSPSKHAVQTFVHTVRRQVAEMGIRVGSIAPGSVATELWGITDPAEIERLTVKERQYVRAEDVAQAVIFMLSQPPHVTIRDLVILPQGQDI
jgi:ribitol 2-dehydrogenase